MRTSIPFRQCWNFYPRSPCGERPLSGSSRATVLVISIHALLAESDKPAERHASTQQEFLSTLSLRRATFHRAPPLTSGAISIHALLAESDQIFDDISGETSHFYPRSPCGERLEEVSGDTWARDFYPRSPCGERRKI